MLHVGSCQTPEILGDVEGAVACIEAFARQADQSGIDLLLFPECFLQGYLVKAAHLRRHAVALDSAPFQAVLERLRPIRPTLVVGLIERHGEKYFNTAVVVQSGHVPEPALSRWKQKTFHIHSRAGGISIDDTILPSLKRVDSQHPIGFRVNTFTTAAKMAAALEQVFPVDLELVYRVVSETSRGDDVRTKFRDVIDLQEFAKRVLTIKPS